MLIWRFNVVLVVSYTYIVILFIYFFVFAIKILLLPIENLVGATGLKCVKISVRFRIQYLWTRLLVFYFYRCQYN